MSFPGENFLYSVKGGAPRRRRRPAAAAALPRGRRPAVIVGLDEQSFRDRDGQACTKRSPPMSPQLPSAVNASRPAPRSPAPAWPPHSEIRRVMASVSERGRAHA